MSGAPPPLGLWQARRLTAEAIGWLVIARTLVARVPFARWRDKLGARLEPAHEVPSNVSLRPSGNLQARRLASAVERAAGRLPGGTRCLPRAMALHWMLARRGLGSSLHIGVRPGAARGGLDDLHAWVAAGGEVLIGASDTRYAVLYMAGSDPPAG